MFEFLIIVAPFMVLLAVGGIVADYVFPHIGFLNRFIDSLPNADEDRP